MNNNIDWKLLSMKIIGSSGMATSCAIESFKLSRENKFDDAKAKLNEANMHMAEAIEEHVKAIKAEKSGDTINYDLLFLHAEAQMTTSQSLIIMANEVINIYKEIAKGKVNEKS